MKESEAARYWITWVFWLLFELYCIVSISPFPPLFFQLWFWVFGDSCSCCFYSFLFVFCFPIRVFLHFFIWSVLYRFYISFFFLLNCDFKFLGFLFWFFFILSSFLVFLFVCFFFICFSFSSFSIPFFLSLPHPFTLLDLFFFFSVFSIQHNHFYPHVETLENLGQESDQVGEREKNKQTIIGGEIWERRGRGT